MEKIQVRSIILFIFWIEYDVENGKVLFIWTDGDLLLLFFYSSEHGRNRALVYWSRRRTSGLDFCPAVCYRLLLHILGKVM